MHINEHEKISWIRKHFETPGSGDFTNDEKKLILARLTRATGYIVHCILVTLFIASNRFQLRNIPSKEISI